MIYFTWLSMRGTLFIMAEAPGKSYKNGHFLLQNKKFN
jgi:hypothetical protein